jgi:hypothetical protein
MIARWSLLRELVALCAVVGGLLFVWSAPALAQREHVFSKSFGSEGSGEGQFIRPGALAVNDETGDVYVMDQGNQRVDIFSATGEPRGHFNGSASPTGPFSWSGRSGGVGLVGSIAVDNSTNPGDLSKGDVYVLDHGHNLIDKFSASGVYLGQVTGTSPTSPFPDEQVVHVMEIAVDPAGQLWVQLFETTLDVFNDAPANEYVSQIELKPRLESLNLASAAVSLNVGFAIDSEGNVYIARLPEGHGEAERTVPTKFSRVGEVLAEELDGENVSGFAVDASSNDVYVDQATSVAAYSPSTSLIERFGASQLQASEGIAVDSTNGLVYVSDASAQDIDVYTAFVVPDATTGSASNLAETSATVSGVVNADGLPVSSCVIEYGTSTEYGQSEPCAPSPGSGSEPVTVAAQLKGLQPLTMYHYRLNVSNANGSNQGRDRMFVTPEPVALSEESVSDVSSTSALFSVQVNPGGADTTYHFEYGTSESYGESVPVPAGDLGSGTSAEIASVRAQDLLGETTYHVRVVASNVLGTVYGPDETFTTQAAGGAFVLPDGREWEMVSPPVKDGAEIFAVDQQRGEGLVESSLDGGAVTYLASAPVGTGPVGNPAPFGPTQVLSVRGSSSWSSEDITTREKAAGENVQSEYPYFSSDFSRGLVEPYGDLPLSPDATETTLYIRENDDGSYVPLVTASDVEPAGTVFGPFHDGTDPRVLAVTPNLSHVLFASPYALTSNAIAVRGEGGSPDNIYEWSEGRLQLVNVLPNGMASPGAITERMERSVLSNDGSRVFFEAEPEGETNGESALFMRDTVTGKTIQVDAPAPGVSPPRHLRARFQIASADGSKVFFLDDEPLTLDSKLAPGAISGYDLYVYDVTSGSLTDLTVDQSHGEYAGVTTEPGEILGASEDGSIVYFVAAGKLAAGAEPGKDNLYVESETGSTWSAPRLVAVLSAEDSADWGAEAGHNRGVGRITSRVSPNGQFVAFMSERRLTGYDNRDAVSGQSDEEAFLYGEATSQLRCVSCDPTGARPDGLYDSGEPSPLVDEPGAWRGRWLAASIPEWTNFGDTGAELDGSYQSRVLSDDGRMFFDSPDALVPQDTNGREDVYEYEPQGIGSCARAGGCVSLISSGTSAEESEFLDASETGDDVFFLTAARLTAQDVDSSFDVYDAHVCSTAAPCASAPVSAPPCTSGDSCKAAPSPQPAIFGAPSSATFSGAGNVASPGSAGSVNPPKESPKKKSAHRKHKAKRRGRGRKSRDSGKSSRSRKGLSVKVGGDKGGMRR